MKFASFLLPFALAGILSAQQPAATSPDQAKSAHPSIGVLRNLVSDLSLSPDQSKQVRGIMTDAAKQNRQIAPKIRENRASLMDAVRSGRQDDIDRITAQNGQLQGQESAIRMKAISQIYALLTPDQKTKLDEKLANMGNRRSHYAARASR